MKQIICPNCKGTKVKDLGNMYRCLYCGTTFSVEEEREKEQPAQQQATPVAPQVIYIQQQPVQQPQTIPTPQRVSNKSRSTAAILAFVLGGLGVHYFYLGETAKGLLCLLFCWTWIPSIVGVIEAIRYMCMSDKEFDMKYNYKK